MASGLYGSDSTDVIPGEAKMVRGWGGCPGSNAHPRGTALCPALQWVLRDNPHPAAAQGLSVTCGQS